MSATAAIGAASRAAARAASNSPSPSDLSITSPLAGGREGTPGGTRAIQGILGRKKFKLLEKEKSAIAQVDQYHAEAGLPPVEDFAYANIDTEYISKLADYLANHARDRRSKDESCESPHISLSSALGYISAYKMYWLRRFPDDPPPQIFEASRWRGINAAITADVVDRCRRTNTNISNPHERATTEDRKGLATICFWEGTQSSLNYHWMCTTMAHCAGRGSEVAGAHTGNLGLMEVHEGNNIYKTPVIKKLLRNKTTTVQDLAIFCDQGSVLLDWIFAAATSLAVSTASHPLFPEFFEKIVNFQDQKMDSQVSKKWESFYKTFYTIAEEVCKDFEGLAESDLTEFLEKMNPDLSSHCKKKHALQKMAESPILNAISTCFRAGFMMKNVSTFFDYATVSPQLDKRAAKICANWTLQDPFLNEVGGGRPPSLDDVTVSLDKLNSFVEELFRAHQDISMEFKRLLAASILRFFDEFVEVLKADPRDNYKKDDKSDHPFVARVHAALSYAGAGLQLFNTWKKEVREGFVAANYNYLSIKTVENDIEGTIRVDPRSINQLVGQIGTSIDGLNHTLQMVLANQISLQRSVNRCLELHGEGPNAAVDTLPDAPTYHSIIPVKGDKNTLADLFIKWFNYDLAEAWDRESDKGQTAKHRFGDHKIVVATMLKYADSHPDPKPTESVARTNWYTSLQSLGKSLMDKVKEAHDLHGIPYNNNVTRASTKKLAKVGEIAMMPLPANTPPDSPLLDTNANAAKRAATAAAAPAPAAARQRTSASTEGEMPPLGAGTSAAPASAAENIPAADTVMAITGADDGADNEGGAVGV